MRLTLTTPSTPSIRSDEGVAGRRRVHPLAQGRAATLALVGSTMATAVVLIGGRHLAAGSYFVAMAGAYGMFGALLVALHRRPEMHAWPVVVAGGALLIVAMVQPPIESGDIWSYASYGRMVAVYHQNPWSHVPADHPADPFTHRVAHVWRRTPSVYGPAFAGPAAAVMAVAGANATLARLGFQLLAALSVAIALWLVGRETHWNPTAIAILAVNPLMPICLVNGGHNDAWVGVLLLGAVLLATRRRWAWTGLVVALAAMVKITALLAIVALAVWAWRRAGRRAAATVTGTAALACSAMVLAAGGSDVVRAMRWNSWRMTGGNLWSRSRGWVLAELGGAPRTDQAHLAAVAVIATVAFAAFLVIRHRRASHPALLVGLTVIAYALISAYLWPWYVVWGLIPLALCPKAPTTRLLVGLGALLELAGVPGDPLSHHSSRWSPALHSAGLLTQALPWILALLAGTVAITGFVRWRDGTTFSDRRSAGHW